MKTFPALLVLCDGNPTVTGGFPLQMSVTRNFDVFFDVCLNKRLNKQSRCQWFETRLFIHSHLDPYENTSLTFEKHYKVIITVSMCWQIMILEKETQNIVQW